MSLRKLSHGFICVFGIGGSRVGLDSCVWGEGCFQKCIRSNFLLAVCNESHRQLSICFCFWDRSDRTVRNQASKSSLCAFHGFVAAGAGSVLEDKGFGLFHLGYGATQARRNHKNTRSSAHACQMIGTPAQVHQSTTAHTPSK